MSNKSSRPEKKLKISSTETTEKSTSARASRDYKVTVPCLLTHSLCLHLFSVTSVVPQARDEILLGLRPRAALYHCLQPQGRGRQGYRSEQRKSLINRERLSATKDAQEELWIGGDFWEQPSLGRPRPGQAPALPLIPSSLNLRFRVEKILTPQGAQVGSVELIERSVQA